MRDSDWSREILLRSDWSGPTVATITTFIISIDVTMASFILKEGTGAICYFELII